MPRGGEVNLSLCCGACGGKCCRHHPHLTQQEYEILRKFCGEKVDACEPEEIQPGVWRLKGDCPALWKTGCCIPPESRPLVCQLYPFTAFRTDSGWILLLDVKGCPFWNIWGEQYRFLEAILMRHLKEALRRSQEEYETRRDTLKAVAHG